MALRQYLTHPDDDSPVIAHVVDGALQVQEVNPSGAKGEPFSVRTGPGLITINNDTVPILSVQHAGVGALEMLLRQFELYNDGSAVAIVDLVHGGTLTAPAFAAVDPASEMEFDLAATAITGGRVLATLYVGRDTTGKLTDDINSALQINLATPGPISVVVTDENEKRVKVMATLGWIEK